MMRFISFESSSFLGTQPFHLFASYKIWKRCLPATRRPYTTARQDKVRNAMEAGDNL